MDAQLVAPVASPAVVEAALFRKSVSLFATGIAVVTCDDGEGLVHGMTINSFTSISLDPPTVLVSLKPGRTHRAISRRGAYGVSILHHEQQSFSAHFSGKPQLPAPEFVVRNRVPTLKDSLAWFECEVESCVQIHDHTLFVARVVACDAVNGSPLMFFASKHHRNPLLQMA
jgi:styrene monooxygenase reductase component